MAQAIILKKRQLMAQYKKEMSNYGSYQGTKATNQYSGMSEEEIERQIQGEATKEILWQFVQEEKLHQLPKSMLQS